MKFNILTNKNNLNIISEIIGCDRNHCLNELANQKATINWKGKRWKVIKNKENLLDLIKL